MSSEVIIRNDALDAFQILFSARAQRNVLYIEAEGGMGKTFELRRIIDYCRMRPGAIIHQHTVKDPADVVIDFYDTRHRTIGGLRHSIIERLGESHFETFLSYESALHKAEAEFKTEKPSGKSADKIEAVAETGPSIEPASDFRIASLRRRTDDAFFADFRRAVSQRWIALFFDTFEVAHQRRVGRWFLNEFLKRAENCLIVFAGRPPQDKAPDFQPGVVVLDLPPRVMPLPLLPWGPERITEYLSKKEQVAFAEHVHLIHQRTRGVPLLIELVYYMYLGGGSSVIADLERDDIEMFRRNLVMGLVREGSPAQEMLRDIVYLRRRFDVSIFERMDKPEEITTFAELRDKLRSSELSPVVKYRHNDQEEIFTPHDLFYENLFSLVTDPYAPSIQRRIWEHWQDVHDQIVEGWYDEAINTLSNTDAAEPRSFNSMRRKLLIAEQLGYILDRGRIEPNYLVQGMQRYHELFAQIQQVNDFELNELVWGELYERLSLLDKTQMRDVIEAQADWLFATGQFIEAADLYEELDAGAESNARASRWLVRCGHALARTGNRSRAERVLRRGLERAISEGDLRGQATYKWNLAGQIFVPSGAWEQALKFYGDAIAHYRDLGLSGTMGDIYIAVARLRARMGDAKRAVADCQTALQLIRTAEPAFTDDRMALALVYAGDIYRYIGDTDTAHNYYLRADRLFAKGGRPDWRVEAASALGVNFHRIGVKKRDALGDVERAVIDQQEALKQVNRGLSLIRRHGLTGQLPLVLNRLGDILLECEVLLGQSEVEHSESVRTLVEQLRQSDLPEEEPWRHRLINGDTPFPALPYDAKAQRLYEVAFYEAYEQEQYHAVLDNLAAAALVARQRNKPMEVYYYIEQIERLKGTIGGQQQELFLALADVIDAELKLEAGRDVAATLNQYVIGVAQLVRLGGFGLYLVRPRQQELRRMVLARDPQEALDWCDMLLRGWERHANDGTDIEEFSELVRSLRNQVVARRNRRV